MKTIEKYAQRGEQCDIMKALTLLTKAYISQCGISLGTRTVIYCAAEFWQERLAWLDLPLSAIARKVAFVDLMPHISSEYDPEIYDEYDIAGMGNKELLRVCRNIVRFEEFDEPTLEVLCWGILKATENKDFIPKGIEVTAPDGTILKGELTEQRRGCTCITMFSPYENLQALKVELIRDARELLLNAYNDYNHFYKSEKKIRELYAVYQEELRKRESVSSWQEHLIFDSVFHEVLDGTVLIPPRKLFNEWFGLEFPNLY